MPDEKYIRCRNCDEIHHVSAFDKTPVYNFVDGSVRESAADDWRRFMDRHAGHKLEALKAIGEKYFPNGSVADPMSVAYIPVTDGSGKFLLRRSRRSIEDPLSYELVGGRIAYTGASLEVRENEIRKEMKHHFQWAPAEPLSDEKIDLFVRLFAELARGLNPEERMLSEFSYVSPSDSVACSLLDKETIEKLMAKCAAHFNPSELESLRRFIESHRGDGDVMALLIRRQFKIEQSAC